MDESTENRVIRLFSRNIPNSGDRPPGHGGTRARVTAVTSGKGGVGKTSLSINVGAAMAREGSRVLLVDGDLSLGNIDLFLGLSPAYHLGHAVSGERTLAECAEHRGDNLYVLAAPSGMSGLGREFGLHRRRLSGELDNMLGKVDVVLLDTGGGIGPEVMLFNRMADDVVVVVTPEPASVTDAYALVKKLAAEQGRTRFGVVVNLARSAGEAHSALDALRKVCGGLDDVSLRFLGHLPYDRRMHESVTRQEAVVDLYPDSRVARGFFRIAQRFTENGPGKPVSGGGARNRAPAGA
ncbi:MAG: P-loop NTPase [Desulfatibacillaceae bacterium]